MLGEGAYVPPQGASLQTGSKQDAVSSPESLTVVTEDEDDEDTEGSELSFLGFLFLLITHFFIRSSFPSVKAVLPHILLTLVLSSCLRVLQLNFLKLNSLVNRKLGG